MTNIISQESEKEKQNSHTQKNKKERSRQMDEIEKILKQKYLSANDIMVIIPSMCRSRALKLIAEIQEDMRLKGYYVPETKTKLALTKLVTKKLGL